MRLIAEIVGRATTDRNFLVMLRMHPEEALNAYDLTPEEKNIFLSGDLAKLKDLGLDENLIKRLQFR